ncbi:DUF362 domain-containing protein [Acidobacteriota bacterium]
MSGENGKIFNRRDFIRGSIIGLASLPALKIASLPLTAQNSGRKAKLALVKTGDRKAGVAELIKLMNVPPMKGKNVFVKPNFNTSDTFPGSTHNDTLTQLIIEIQAREAGKITVGDRSGPEPTKEVLQKKGIFDLSSDLGFNVVNFSELAEKDWVQVKKEGFHWKDGFSVPRSFIASDYIVSTCCLKTHGFGGIFTLSLKLSVGVTPKSLMRELHGMRQTHMRRMIAEINTSYSPQLVVLDGVEAFVDGGPMEGTKKTAEVMIAGTDRVALDAAGLAVLKHLGSNEAIMNTKIFEQEQILRAVELGLGVSSPEKIEFLTSDPESQAYASDLQALMTGELR